jgi:glutathione S-transferase
LILIGMFDSPFVRRVALGRVPALVQPDGEALIESTAILDFLDECAGTDRALLPRSGKERREALRIMAAATGAAEKGVTQVYETVFRPAEKRYQPWLDRCNTQMHAALAELDRLSQARLGGWFIGNRMTQADITATCVYTFLADALTINRTAAYPGLAAIAQRCEALPEFRSVKADWFPPGENA